MISIQTTIDDARTAEMIRMLTREVGPAGREKLNENATIPVSALVKKHVLEAAQTRHSTADNIRRGPAHRTGHLESAADSVSYTFDSEGGAVTVSSPGFRRALGPLTIRPVSKQFLTIAVDALSYGETVSNLRARGIPVFRRKDYLATRYEGQFRVLYLLRHEVTLKHDPGLMPAIEQMGDAAKAGIEQLVLKILGAA